MEHNRYFFRLVVSWVLLFLVFFISGAQNPGLFHSSESQNLLVAHYKSSSASLTVDSFMFSAPLIHRLEAEARYGYILPTNPFLKGENNTGKPVNRSFSQHLKYSFRFSSNTYTDRIYGTAYQGIGLARYHLQQPEELGRPFMLYLFQGARIGRINPKLSLNYEWNFGLSFGWKPYDDEFNPNNKIIGSKSNAYLNANFYFSWLLSQKLDFNVGASLTHFSNGNTKFPNAGLNTVGVKAGLVYNFNRTNRSHTLPSQLPTPVFIRHISYDLVLFGSWRRTGVDYLDGQVASPEAYPVLGFCFSPMYNYDYKLRLGISLDGLYDGSANVYTRDYIVGTEQEFFKPPLSRQLALGISGRLEYVMPYFTVGLGVGRNVLCARGDLQAFYQILALKVEVTRSSFVHIGYSLQDFHTPNFLMLGIGFRFNNRYPVFYRK